VQCLILIDDKPNLHNAINRLLCVAHELSIHFVENQNWKLSLILISLVSLVSNFNKLKRTL
jgi:hypothetical protein